jgi:hypothetical protein
MKKNEDKNTQKSRIYNPSMKVQKINLSMTKSMESYAKEIGR